MANRRLAIHQYALNAFTSSTISSSRFTFKLSLKEAQMVNSFTSASLSRSMRCATEMSSESMLSTEIKFATSQSQGLIIEQQKCKCRISEEVALTTWQLYSHQCTSCTSLLLCSALVTIILTTDRSQLQALRRAHLSEQQKSLEDWLNYKSEKFRTCVCSPSHGTWEAQISQSWITRCKNYFLMSNNLILSSLQLKSALEAR